MINTKDTFGAIAFALAIVTLAPLLLIWFIVDKVCGRDFLADLDDEDWYE